MRCGSRHKCYKIARDFGESVITLVSASLAIAGLSTPFFSITTLLRELGTTSERVSSPSSRQDLQHGIEVITLSYGASECIHKGKKSHDCRNLGSRDFFLFWMRLMKAMMMRRMRIGPITPQITFGPPVTYVYNNTKSLIQITNQRDITHCIRCKL